MRGMGGIGGPGFPQPDVPGKFSRGVDLSIVKHKRLYGHKWIMVANFAVDSKSMQELATVQDKARVAAANGTEMEPTTTNIPMDNSVLLGYDGPGCAKCGLDWKHESGYGSLCSVSDEEPAFVVTPPPNSETIMQQIRERDQMLAADPGLMSIEEATEIAEAEEAHEAGLTEVDPLELDDDEIEPETHVANLDGDG